MRFYDTCSLLKRVDRLFDEDNEKFIISSVTLNELENIKTSANKDVDTKFAARKLLHLLDSQIAKTQCGGDYSESHCFETIYLRFFSCRIDIEKCSFESLCRRKQCSE